MENGINSNVDSPNGEIESQWAFDAEDPIQKRSFASFHKTLQHNKFGEVNPHDFEKFVDIIESGNFEDMALSRGMSDGKEEAAKLVSPQSGRSMETHGPDPMDLTMPPAPRYDGLSVMAEMTELYWMALLRDLSFDAFDGDPEVAAAMADLGPLFEAAMTDEDDPGRLQAGVDVPMGDVTLQTLFRCGLPGEDKGPIVSQFFLHDAQYGTQLIVQKQFPYLIGVDYLTTHHEWLRAQNIGRDFFDDAYPDANDPSDPAHVLEGGDDAPAYRRISTMRDLARFVHKDALHQAYFNTALKLLSWGAETDPGNPYNGYRNQAAFATLGGPHLLALVSEVASRALKVVWRQKWQVHLRQRPEAYGGLVQMQKEGYKGTTRAYGLPPEVSETAAAKRIFRRYGTYFLPMAFTSGSPVHPAYGAGHATVAGACVTILKAWFNEDQKIHEIFAGLKSDGTPRKDGKKPRHPRTGQPLRIVQPGLTGVHRDEYGNEVSDGTGGYELPTYKGPDASDMTVGGELNKIACNVAMGRSMGGVHWRSDNTRSLRLGEEIAVHILQKMVNETAESSVSFTFTTFDGQSKTIEKNPAADAPSV